METVRWSGLVIVWICVVINGYYAVYSFRAAKRWSRLNKLYLELCMSAWQMKDWPVARQILQIPEPPPEPSWWRRSR